VDLPRGELRKLGVRVGDTTIRRTLKTAGLGAGTAPIGSDVVAGPPRPSRGGLATDFCTVETIRPKTLYVLVFIELASDAWVTPPPVLSGHPNDEFSDLCGPHVRRALQPSQTPSRLAARTPAGAETEMPTSSLRSVRRRDFSAG
jgi:hypothetical protein